MGGQWSPRKKVHGSCLCCARKTRWHDQGPCRARQLLVGLFQKNIHEEPIPNLLVEVAVWKSSRAKRHFLGKHQLLYWVGSQIENSILHHLNRPNCGQFLSGLRNPEVATTRSSQNNRQGFTDVERHGHAEICHRYQVYHYIDYQFNFGADQQLLVEERVPRNPHPNVSFICIQTDCCRVP